MPDAANAGASQGAAIPAIPEELVIPDEVKETFPDLIPQIIASPSMDLNEKNYWFSVLPIMTPDQVSELRDILKSEQKRLEKGVDEEKAEEPEIDLVEAERRREEKRQAMKNEEKRLLNEDSAQAENLLAEL